MKIVVRGILKNTSEWIDLSYVSIDDKDATPEEIDQAVEQMRDIVASAYKNGTSGHLTADDVVIDIQSFAAISIRRRIF